MRGNYRIVTHVTHAAVHNKLGHVLHWQMYTVHSRISQYCIQGHCMHKRCVGITTLSLISHMRLCRSNLAVPCGLHFHPCCIGTNIMLSFAHPFFVVQSSWLFLSACGCSRGRVILSSHHQSWWPSITIKSTRSKTQNYKHRVAFSRRLSWYFYSFSPYLFQGLRNHG